jgi:hypothetical protein
MGRGLSRPIPPVRQPATEAAAATEPPAPGIINVRVEEPARGAAAIWRRRVGLRTSRRRLRLPVVALEELALLPHEMFDCAITLARNQIGGYIGMAAIYGLVGNREKSHKYAKLGLRELEKMRKSPAGRAMCDSTIFPADIHEQSERQLRSYLA